MKGAYFDALMFDSSNASFLYIVAVKIYLISKVISSCRVDMVLNNKKVLFFVTT